jgi:hypothetical protein
MPEYSPLTPPLDHNPPALCMRVLIVSNGNNKKSTLKPANPPLNKLTREREEGKEEGTIGEEEREEEEEFIKRAKEKQERNRMIKQNK